ncbi:MAG TPA: choice-of-anchor Q domain-containing protein [Rhodanobacteraceae bacterium]|nr:choice-of-anchor Q domain-containing protein [Rhodanobacteraceae bacterium]
MQTIATNTRPVVPRPALLRAPHLLLAISLALLLAAPVEVRAQDSNNVCRVTATGTGNGIDWSSPMDLQTALGNHACHEIWVAAGTYTPTSGTDRNARFNIRAGVEAYGGFAGGETQRAERNPAINRVTLSGDIGLSGDNSDNSLHVVFFDGRVPAPIHADTVLDGFTIADGNANDATAFNGNLGGGIYCDGSYGPGSECSPTLRNLVIKNNNASGSYGGMGGGMVSYGRQGISSPRLENVRFSDNAAHNDNNGLAIGGAMYNNGESGISNPSLENVTFENNSATGNSGTASGYGGAMYNDGSNGESSPLLDQVTFVGNTASGMDGRGGAMYNHGFGGQTRPRLTNVTFSDNSASGAVYGAEGGAMFNGGFQGIAAITVNNVTFSGNSVSGATANNKGAAIYVAGEGSDDQLTLTNAILWDDNSTQNAEIAYTSATISIDHSIVAGGCPGGATCSAVSTSDPQLGPLADNGGLTQTMRIESSSTAVDAGSDSSCASTDQRGVARPQLAHCDIGAVEYKLTDEDRIFANGFELPVGQR